MSEMMRKQASRCWSAISRGDVLGGGFAPLFGHGSNVELVIDHLEGQPDLLTESRVRRERPVVGIGHTRPDLERHRKGWYQSRSSNSVISSADRFWLVRGSP